MAGFFIVAMYIAFLFLVTIHWGILPLAVIAVTMFLIRFIPGGLANFFVVLFYLEVFLFYIIGIIAVAQMFGDIWGVGVLIATVIDLSRS